MNKDFNLLDYTNIWNISIIFLFREKKMFDSLEKYYPSHEYL